MPAALIIVDPQNDFCENGSLAVPDSNAIFPVINSLKKLNLFSNIYLTADNHPENHISFASRHQLPPFTTITLQNGQKQELWPDHCIAGTLGQKNSELLEINGKEIVIKKGENA
jgi:nicotinamidase/pyrazinamidase